MNNGQLRKWNSLLTTGFNSAGMHLGAKPNLKFQKRCSPLFNGVNSRLVFPNIPAYQNFINTTPVDGNPIFTISGWFYVTGSTGQSQCIISNDEGTVGSGFILAYTNSGSFNFQIRSTIATTKNSFPVNKWHHFIVKRNGVIVNDATIKINGIKQEFTGPPSWDFMSKITSIHIGALPSATGPANGYRAFFKGYIDDLIWINRITTDFEDRQLFRDKKSIPKSLEGNILFHSKFSEVVGSSVKDYSSNNNDGTISNISNTKRSIRTK